MSLAITLCMCYVYSLELIFVYVKPFLSFERSFIFTELTEALHITLKICAIASLCSMLPLLCYQLWCFLLPSLYNLERHRCSIFLLTSTLLSAMALLSVHLLILPEIATILLGFEIKSQVLVIQLEARIDSYVNWSSKLFLAVLLCGQLPLISYLSFRVGLLDPNLLTRNRKALLALSLLMAALLSPPDLIAQWLFAISISCWIETIIWLGMICSRKR